MKKDRIWPQGSSWRIRTKPGTFIETVHTRLEPWRTIPQVDQIDIIEKQKPRQFAPEYAHDAYLTQLRSEKVLGNYIAKALKQD